MTEHTNPPPRDPSLGPLLRSFLLEIAIYAPLVVLYFLLILRFANHRLTDLFLNTPRLYAFVATAAIVGQGVLLEWLTSLLVRRFGLRK